MENQVFDPAKAEAFAGQMLGIVNGGHTALATGIGHSTGLFETMAALPPSTSVTIALNAGLNERYVREWLAVMVISRIIEYDAESATYFLPPEHAAFLTRAAGPDNMAIMAQFVEQGGLNVNRVTECFYKGGGVPYEYYGSCMHCIASLGNPSFDSYLIDRQLPFVPGLTEKLKKGIDVLDVGCGHGHAVNVMAKVFPGSRFTGYDFLEESIAEARKEAKADKLENVRFEVKDVSSLDEPAAYDLVTAFDAIHDQAHPRQVLRSIYEALRPDGLFFMADIKASSRLEENMEHPIGPTLYTVSLLHCMTVSLAYGGEGLGTMWGKEKALELLKEAGFRDTEVKEMEEDILNCYYISMK